MTLLSFYPLAEIFGYIKVVKNFLKVKFAVMTLTLKYGFILFSC